MSAPQALPPRHCSVLRRDEIYPARTTIHCSVTPIDILTTLLSLLGSSRRDTGVRARGDGAPPRPPEPSKSPALASRESRAVLVDGEPQCPQLDGNVYTIYASVLVRRLVPIT